MVTSDTKELGQIIQAGLYRVPNYQRGYAWTAEEVESFLDDLDYIVAKSGEDAKHYIGSIIVTERDYQSYEIIDGQQRLITTSLIAHEILRKARELAQKSKEDSDIQGRKTDIEKHLRSLLYKIGAEGENKRRVLPADKHREIFRRLYKEEADEKRDMKSIKKDISSPSEEKMVEAVETIDERLDQWMEIEEKNSENSLPKKMLRLNNISSALVRQMTATRHPVQDRKEAGRMFEAVNDRGRDLNRADRIKSYLVYRASNSDVNMNPTEIHETFANVYEELNQLADRPEQIDSLIESLIGVHWRVFVNEDSISNNKYLEGRYEKINKDIEQIKYGLYHASKARDDEETQKWIKEYLNSLETVTSTYKKIRGIENQKIWGSAKEDLETQNKLGVRHSLYVAENFGVSTYHSLLVSMYIRFSDSPKFDELMKDFESMIMRIFEVGGARRDTKRTKFESLSRALFWSKRKEDLSNVFGQKDDEKHITHSINEDIDNFNLTEDKDLETVRSLITNWAKDYTYETQEDEEIDKFKNWLGERNLDGVGVANWSGLRNSEAKNYMLFRYEEIICEPGGLPNSSYIDSEIKEITIEHVWPKDKPDDLSQDLSNEEYEIYKNRLGNLALLKLTENITAGNKPYKEKWRNTYSDLQGTEMISKEFPHPEKKLGNLAGKNDFIGWSDDVIEWRSTLMADKLAKYWSVN